MRILMLALLTAPILLAGCVPPAPPPASAYRAAPQFAPATLRFAPDADETLPLDTNRLRALRLYLPAGALPELFIAGPRSFRRAQVVRRLLERPVAVHLVEDEMALPDAAVLLVPAQGGVIADACLGPGQPVLGDIWPGDDARRTALLPAGCAVETALQSQVAAHGGDADLLHGRPLPPGAATPFAEAIERYYRRNDPRERLAPAAGDSSSNSGGRSGGSAPAGAGPSSAEETDSANPLLGALPRASLPPAQGQAAPSQSSPSQPAPPPLR